MPALKDQTPDNLDQLSKQQLEVYAKELREHFNEERRLRRELEKQNQLLEQRVREISALNHLFQEHLAQRSAVVQAYRAMLGELDKLAHDAATLAQSAKSQPLPELSDVKDGNSGARIPPHAG